jgi:hypothetical protein
MSSEFEEALTNNDLQSVRACPKADLHTHGWANSDREYIYRNTGRDIAPVDAPLASMQEMHD